jgi:peptidoglycan/xylan/chitin deacetylase (PgdA/CDA1 family)
MLRRQFLAASAAGFLFPEIAHASNSPLVVPDPVIRERVASPLGPLGFQKTALEEGRRVRLPKSDVKRIAWTVDDGSSTEGVRDYLDFVERFDLRMTFFINSVYPAWRKNQQQIQELVENGNLQLANHTHSHPSMTRLSSAGIRQELRKCHSFIEDNFGVSAKPYYRPPYGRIDARVIEVANDIGYTSPVMWSGSLGDSASQRKQYILQLGNKWIQDRTILLDHFNQRTPRYVFKELAKMLKRRELLTVTLDDVYYT